MSDRTLDRFIAEKQAKLVERVGGDPDIRENMLIKRLLKHQWSARECRRVHKTAIDDQERAAALDRVIKFEELVLAADQALADATAAKLRLRLANGGVARILPANRNLKTVAPPRIASRPDSEQRRKEYLEEHAPDGNPTSTQLRLIRELVRAEEQRDLLQLEANAAPDEHLRTDKQRLVDRAAKLIVLLGRDLRAATNARNAAGLAAKPKTYRELVAERASD